MAKKLSVGFAGLGAMGYGMASNLLNHGFSVTGFDPSPIARERFAAIGGSVVSDLADASRDQHVFFVMVATPAQVDSVVLSANGIATSLPKNAILCLFSTLPPNYVANFPAQLAERGRSDIRLLDCPVSGGVIMIGGEMSTFDQIKPYLHAIASPERLFYCGGLGDASTIKMLNQLLAGSHIVAAAEVLSFARAMGLSTRQTYDIVMSGISASWIFGDRGKSMLSADWSPKSAVTIFTKDLGIVADAARKVDLNAPITFAALREFQHRVDTGYGGTDDASVVCNYEDAIPSPVCENEPHDSLPTPPNEAAPPLGALTGVSFLSVENAERDLSISIPQGTDTSSPGLFIISALEASMETKLTGLPDGSVVVVTNFTNPTQAKASLQEFRLRFPGLHFTDSHIIPAQNLEGAQLLFSAESHEISAAVGKVLPKQLIAVPVKGPVGSASSMMLAIRLGVLIHVAAAAECCRLAQAKKVSTDLVYKLIAGAAGSSSMFNVYFPFMRNNDYEPKAIQGFDTFQRAVKDLVVLKDVAESINFPGKILNATSQIFDGAQKNLEESRVSVAAVAQFWK